MARLHALWTLDLLAVLDSAAISLGLEDPEPRVREQAIRLAEPRISREPALLNRLLAMVDDHDAMVRYQLAFSLGEAGADARVIPALAAIASHDASSQWTRAAVMSSISGRSIALLSALAQHPGFLTRPDGAAWIDDLAFLAGSERDPSQAQEFLDRLGTIKLGSSPMMHAALSLARGRQRAGGSVRDLLNGKSSDRMASLLKEAVRIAGANDNQQDRVVAIRLIGLADPTSARGSFPTLLDARQPIAVQLAVLQALAGRLDRDLAREIIGHWKAMSPSVRREAVEVLFGRREGIEAVIVALESLPYGPSDLDPARLKQLEAQPDASFGLVHGGVSVHEPSTDLKYFERCPPDFRPFEGDDRNLPSRR